MSNLVNDELFNRAAEMIDYFEGKLPAQLIEQALGSNDLDSLRKYVLEAEAEASRQEFFNGDAMPEDVRYA